ncbi:MAG: SPOR domain-containing protein [Vicinamibacterales bacterium]
MRKLFARSGFAWVPAHGRGNASHAAAEEARFTDDEILTVIRAGESGVKLSELCEATGIAVETYYTWKARYGGLTADEMRARRASARTRRRRAAMLACAAGAAALFTAGSVLTRRSDASAIVPAPGDRAGTTAPVTGEPAPDRAQTTPTTRVPAPLTTGRSHATPFPTGNPDAASSPPVVEAAPAVTPRGAAPIAPNAVDPTGFSVQVSATADLQEARLALERLAAAGYSAYVRTKTVKGTAMYRIRVGPLGSLAAAEEMAARLARDGYVSPWVTREVDRSEPHPEPRRPGSRHPVVGAVENREKVQ